MSASTVSMSTKEETAYDAPDKELETDVNVETTTTIDRKIDKDLKVAVGSTINHPEQSKNKFNTKTKKKGDQQKNTKVIGTGPSHTGGGLKNTYHGFSYQMKLPMLYIVRGLKQACKFQVATEVEGADKLDDLLFLYDEDEIGFFQAKHKLNEDLKITEDQLLSTEGDFSITKYLISYKKILNEKELINVLKGRDMILIINTNIGIHGSVLESFESITASSILSGNKILALGTEEEREKYYIINKQSALYGKLAQLLGGLVQPPTRVIEYLAKAVVNNKKKSIKTNELFDRHREWLLANVLEVGNEYNKTQNRHFVTFRDSFLSGSDESVLNFRNIFLETYLSNKQTGKDDTSVQNALAHVKFQIAKSFALTSKSGETKTGQDKVSSFLDRVVFAVEQINEVELGDVIENEIGDYMGHADRQSIACKFQSYIQDWAKQKEGRYLTNQDVERQFAIWGYETSNQIKMDNIKKYKCAFKDSNEIIKKLSNFLNTENGADVLCIYSRETLFSKIKVCQVLEASAIEKNYQQLKFYDIEDLIELENTTRCPVKSFSSQISITLFVSLQDCELYNAEVKILRRLLDVVIGSNRNAEHPQSNTQRKRLIITIPEERKSEFIKKNCISSYGIKDLSLDDFTNNFSELDEQSRRQLMENGRMKHHGNYITGLLSENELALCIRDEMLLKFILSDLELNDALVVTNQYNQEVKQFYANRSLVPVIVGQDITEDIKFHFVRDDTPQTDIKGQEVVAVSTNDKLFEHYRKTNINVHWLEETNKEYIWISSQGSLTNIRKYITAHDTDPFSDTDLNSDKDFASSVDSNMDLEPKNYIPVTNVSDLKNDVVLISASPGMGKSILLSHIAEQSKTEDTSFFVVKTSLVDNLEELDSLKKEENITLKQAIHFTFLATQIESPQIEGSESAFNLLTVQEDGNLAFSPNAGFGNLDNLRAMVFCNLYNKEKIVLLLDGFDEIAPDYSQTTLNLLRTLKHSKVRKMWVTTRPYGLTKDLENCLETFAYTLKPLSENDQFTFFEKFWGNEDKPRHTKILSFVKNFLDLPTTTLRSIFSYSTLRDLREEEIMQNRSKKTFLCVPLHCYMLAKILNKDFVKIYSHNMDDAPAITRFTTFDVYSKFFDIKFDEILHNENLKNPRNRSLREIKKISESDHGKLALLQIYHEEVIAELVPEEDRIKLIDNVTSGNEKVGIVTGVVGNEPQFVHRTFAEYFAAHYLADVLLSPVENRRKEAARSLLYKSVTENLDIYQVLFTFFNYIVVSRSNNKDIFEAAISGNFRKLSEIENVNEIFDPLKRTPMHLIAINLLRILNNIRNLYEEADLTTATTVHSVCHSFIQRLCQSMSHRSSDMLFTWTPTHYLAMGLLKNIWEICPFLFHYFNDDTQDSLGRTPLMLMIIRSKELQCCYNIRGWSTVGYNWKGVNTQDKFLKTALHYALEKFCPLREDELTLNLDKLEFVTVLLKHGACLNIPDNRGVTPEDIVNSVFTNTSKVDLEFDSLRVKDAINEYDKDEIYLICGNYITKPVEEYLCSFQVDIPDCTHQIDLHSAMEQTDDERHVTTNNIKLHLRCILLLQLLGDYDKPILPVPDSEVFAMWYIDYMPAKIAELLIKTSDLHSLSTDNDDHKNVIIFFLSGTYIIAPALLSKFPQFVDVVDSRGKTALHYAVRNENEDCSIALIKNNARVDITDDRGKMPVHIKKENILSDKFNRDKQTIEFIDMLPQEFADRLILAMNPYPLLTQIDADFIVCVLGRYSTIGHVLLSQYPINVNTKDSQGRTALHYAVEARNNKSVCYLIDKNAQVDIADNEGKYPVHFEKDTLVTLESTRESIISMLNFIDTLPLVAAKPLVLTMALVPPLTPSDHVLLNSILDEKHTIASVLWTEYSDLLSTNSLKDNCSYFESKIVSNEVVCILLDKYCIEDFSDNTASKISNEVLKLVVELFSSVRNDNLCQVNTVLESVLNCVNRMCIPKYYYYLKYARLKTKVASVVNARSKDGGKTALHYVAEIGNVEIVKSLLSHGAYYNVPDCHGSTPAQIAKRHSKTAVLHLLDVVELLFKSLFNKSYNFAKSVMVKEQIEEDLLQCICFDSKKSLLYLYDRYLYPVYGINTDSAISLPSSDDNSSCDENSSRHENISRE